MGADESRGPSGPGHLSRFARSHVAHDQLLDLAATIRFRIDGPARRDQPTLQTGTTHVAVFVKRHDARRRGVAQDDGRPATRGLHDSVPQPALVLGAEASRGEGPKARRRAERRIAVDPDKSSRLPSRAKRRVRTAPAGCTPARSAMRSRRFAVAPRTQWRVDVAAGWHVEMTGAVQSKQPVVARAIEVDQHRRKLNRIGRRVCAGLLPLIATRIEKPPSRTL